MSGLRKKEDALCRVLILPHYVACEKSASRNKSITAVFGIWKHATDDLMPGYTFLILPNNCMQSHGVHKGQQHTFTHTVTQVPDRVERAGKDVMKYIYISMFK